VRILVIDIENMGLDFVLRCAAQDHEVRWFRLQDKKPVRDGEGFKGFKFSADWRDDMPWARDGLIFITGNFKYVAELDRYRDLGYKIFGPTVASAKLEIDRQAFMALVETAGIEVPHYEMFNSFNDAEKFARKSDKAYVFKPLGDEADKSLTYVASDPADMVGWLQRQIKAGKVLKGRCMLQEKIDLCCEFGVSGWFGPDGFLPDKWQECVEHKKLMDGEIGPATGEQGTLTQYVEKSKLADEMLMPLVPTLKQLGHCGDFAVGVGIGKDGKAYPFECTARTGWPAFFNQVASHKGDMAQWMHDLCDGKDSLKVSNDICLSVVMAQPRYPYNNSPPELVEGNPISGVEDVADDVHFASVMLAKGPMMKDGKIVDGPVFQTTGEYVLVATGLGKTIERAHKNVYAVVDAVKFPNAMFRRDIGRKVQRALPEMQKFGYALDMKAG
jgi:phosphoribosylamine---glycine ligase